MFPLLEAIEKIMRFIVIFAVVSVPLWIYELVRLGLWLFQS